MPLGIWIIKRILVYWVNLQGHYSLPPTKDVLKGCSEHNEINLRCFGSCKSTDYWLHRSPAVPIPSGPLWWFNMPNVDLNLQH